MARAIDVAELMQAPIDALTAQAPAAGVIAHRAKTVGVRAARAAADPAPTGEAACGAAPEAGVKWVRMQVGRALALGAEPCPHTDCFGLQVKPVRSQ